MAIEKQLATTNDKTSIPAGNLTSLLAIRTHIYRARNARLLGGAERGQMRMPHALRLARPALDLAHPLWPGGRHRLLGGQLSHVPGKLSVILHEVVPPALRLERAQDVLHVLADRQRKGLVLGARRARVGAGEAV